MEKNPQNAAYLQCGEPKGSRVGKDGCGQIVTGIEAYYHQRAAKLRLERFRLG